MHFQILFAILKSLKWYKSVYKRENINKCRKYENFPYQILNKLIELQINYWPEMVQLEPKNVDVLKQYFIEHYSTDKIIRPNY
ncbi:hypothetical protein HZS_7702 [Henneguya salminicola]|nr:hypothetical protein HZS_7702 [Henneguya salminicola]